MGLEAVCVAHFGESVSEGKALLEASDLRFRGDFRLTIPFEEMRSVAVENGRLEVAFNGGLVIFELGPAAERWAYRIQHPPLLIDRLDVQPSARVAVLGLIDPAFVSQLRTRTSYVLQHSLAPAMHLIFLTVGSPTALEQIDALEPFLRRDGALWVIAPKGRRPISQTAILTAGRAAGFVDADVVNFSDTQIAIKFVFPKQQV